MRLGCFGCLFLIVALLIVVVVVLGVVFLSTNLLSAPQVRPVPFSKGDGYAAQQKLFEVALRQSGRSSRRDPIVLTEPEANAFLARHLDQAGVPLSPIVVRFAGGHLTAQGQTALRNLFKGPPFTQILPYISDKRLDQLVWVTVRARIRVEGGFGAGSSRYGNVEVIDFVLGKQPLGSFLLSILMGPSGGGLLQWPVPSVVDDIQIREGQLVITTR
jgi:hypothetical protein